MSKGCFWDIVRMTHASVSSKDFEKKINVAVGALDKYVFKDLLSD